MKSVWRADRREWSPVPPARFGILLAMPLIVMVVLLVLYPLFDLVSNSLREESGHRGGLANYRDFLNSPADVRALVTTLVVSAVVTGVCLVVGSLLAWYLRTSGSALGKAFVWLSILAPFWMGVIIKNYSITLLLAPNGLVNNALSALHLRAEPVQFLNTVPAVVVGMVYTMLPWAVLPLYGVFRTIDLELVKAAESLGAYRAKAVISIVPPLALPGVLATFAIVYVISIGFFVTPVLLGGITSPFTASLIALELFNFFDLVAASVAGVILILVALALMSVAWRLVGKERLEKALSR